MPDLRLRQVWHQNYNGHAIDCTYAVSGKRKTQRITAVCSKCGHGAAVETTNYSRPDHLPHFAEECPGDA